MHIYKTTNLLNGKIYIGQTSKDLNTNYLGSGSVVIKAIKKYGNSNFKREVLEECESKECMNNREKHWIQHFDSINRNIGYNVSIGGEGGNLGDKVNQKISETRKNKILAKDISGNIFLIDKDDERFKTRELVGIRKGVIASNKGIPMSDKQKEKMKIPKTEAHKEKLSKAKKGKCLKPIICLNNGITYSGSTEAAEKLGLTTPNIIAVLKGRSIKTKGYSFKYI
jgi:group I intron endonuclease